MIQQMSGELLWSQIVARAWCDEDVMKRLLADPRAVLTEGGLEVPEGTEVQVAEGEEVKVEAGDKVLHLILPVSPPGELAEEDLFGGAVAWCGCGACRRCACGACGACGRCGCRCWW
jgi:hypothetical protein